MQADTWQKAFEYGKESEENFLEALKWELPIGSSYDKLQAKKKLLESLANNWGYDEFKWFTKEKYVSLKQENEDNFKLKTLKKYSNCVGEYFTPTKEGMQAKIKELKSELVKEVEKTEMKENEDLSEWSSEFLYAKKPLESNSMPSSSILDEQHSLNVPTQDLLCELKGEKLGAGEGGIVYKYTPDPKFVVKIFNNKEGYEKEKEMHNELFQRFDKSESLKSLRKSLCLACHSCDKSKALLLPCLDTSNELEKLLSSKKMLSLSKCNQLAHQLEDILTTIHKSGIIHGDFKAKNIIVTRNGPVVIDFGLSEKICKEKENDQRERDVKQLLWIILQLRFHLPFKTQGDVFGLMVEDPRYKKEDDLRWDLQPVIYGLAGSEFDELSLEVSESIKENGLTSRNVWYTMEGVNRVRNEIFNETEISNFSIGWHSYLEWKKIQEIHEILHKSYTDIKNCNVTECYKIVVEKMKKQLNNVIPVRTTRLRLLLSLNSEDFSINSEQEKESIITEFEYVNTMLKDM